MLISQTQKIREFEMASTFLCNLNVVLISSNYVFVHNIVINISAFKTGNN